MNRTKKYLSAGILAVAMMVCGISQASAAVIYSDNIIVNGDFSANASSFISGPGYIGSGGNPQIQSWGFMDFSGGASAAGINGPDTGVGSEPFAPATTVGISNFAFIQNGIALLIQNLPTLLPNQSYLLSVAAANRSGQPGASGRIQIADNLAEIYNSGNQSFSTEAFQTITASFTTPASFNGTPSIQLYGFSQGGESVAFTNVMLQTIPEPSTYAMLLVGGAGLMLVIRRRGARA